MPYEPENEYVPIKNSLPGNNNFEKIQHMDADQLADFLLFVSGAYDVEKANRCHICRYQFARLNCPHYTCKEGIMGFLLGRDVAHCE